ncbi:MAG: adenylosuccinate lyase [Rhodomicrobium sp.]|nr:MAG: adenylosuccinate lyase [Rhodomicrobium sp.]
MKHNPQKDVPVSEIEALFTSKTLWQTWLDIEAALAKTQAELGIIPEEHALVIEQHANFDSIDAAALETDINRTRAPIVSLVKALADAAGPSSGAYVHWGATTQNVMQTGRVLQMKKAHEALKSRLGNIFMSLSRLARDEAETLCAGRTNNRHALPITFGFKVAAWIEEFLRHEERLLSAEHRVFTASWGGAIGAMHAFGAQGPELNERFSKALGLNPVAVPSRAATDHISEYILLLGLLGATCSKIARELYTLMSDEIAEVYEDLGDGVIGSSTMPQKVNSKIAVTCIAQGARLRALLPLALEAMQPSHEGDAANNQMLYSVMDQAPPLAYRMITAMDELLDCLKLRPEQMTKNLALSGQFIVAENAMMHLAPMLGRTSAHDVVHHAVEVALNQQKELAVVLMDVPEVSRVTSLDALMAVLSPENYTGESVSIARRMAAAAAEAAERLQS